MAICSSIHAWKIPRTEEPGHGITKEVDTTQEPKQQILKDRGLPFFFSFKYSEVEYSKNRL